jgi:hypothetical protein
VAPRCLQRVYAAQKWWETIELTPDFRKFGSFLGFRYCGPSWTAVGNGATGGPDSSPGCVAARGFREISLHRTNADFRYSDTAIINWNSIVFRSSSCRFATRTIVRATLRDTIQIVEFEVCLIALIIAFPSCCVFIVASFTRRLATRLICRSIFFTWPCSVK